MERQEIPNSCRYAYVHLRTPQIAVRFGCSGSVTTGVQNKGQELNQSAAEFDICFKVFYNSAVQPNASTLCLKGKCSDVICHIISTFCYSSMHVKTK